MSKQTATNSGNKVTPVKAGVTIQKFLPVKKNLMVDNNEKESDFLGIGTADTSHLNSEKPPHEVFAICNNCPLIATYFVTYIIMAGSNKKCKRVDFKTANEGYSAPFYKQVTEDSGFRDRLGILTVGQIKKGKNSKDCIMAKKGKLKADEKNFPHRQYLTVFKVSKDSNEQQQKKERNKAHEEFVRHLNEQADETHDNKYYNYKYSSTFKFAGEILQTANDPLHYRWMPNDMFNLLKQDKILHFGKLLEDHKDPDAKLVMEYFFGRSTEPFFNLCRKIKKDYDDQNYMSTGKTTGEDDGDDDGFVVS